MLSHALVVDQTKTQQRLVFTGDKERFFCAPTNLNNQVFKTRTKMEHSKKGKPHSSSLSNWGGSSKSEQNEADRLYRLKIRELMLALKSSDLVWALSAYQSLLQEKLLGVPKDLFEQLGIKLLSGQVFAAQELAKKLFAIQYALEALERTNS
jgi:hypothetical protein